MKENCIRRLKLLAEKTREWDNKPQAIPYELRHELADMFAITFREFEDFAELSMMFLGFKITPMQRDIARFMQYGDKKAMVAAQRGEAKSTLAAEFAVWSLIQDHSARVLIVSGGEKQASDVAILVIRLIEQWHLLCWMRPDQARGDRRSFENYDIHCDLKPVDKSASVSCVGITAQLQGKRADLLIPDDVETTKNSLTQTMRDQLLLLTKEFAAINRHGRTLYLGTPQSKDSIYKTLRHRGYSVRIWPGRYPTAEELSRYEEGTVAPMIMDALEADPALAKGGGITGERGKPTDPHLFDEDALIEKELDFGEEGFQLQYMLDTSLADAARTRVKVADLMVYHGDAERAPEVLTYAALPALLLPSGVKPDAIAQEKMYYTANASLEFVPFQHKVMNVDPAGDGGDEVAYACGGALNSYIHLFSVGGYRGGICEENINKILDLCVEFGITDIKIEKNMGHGTVEQLFIAEIDKRKLTGIGVEGYYAVGQKERRIIDTISPLSRRHKFVVHTRALEDDAECCKAHSYDKRSTTSAFYQLANITYDRGSLAKDDRADAIQGMCQHLVQNIALDDGKLEEKRQVQAAKEFIDNPMGYSKPMKRKKRNRQ